MLEGHIELMLRRLLVLFERLIFALPFDVVVDIVVQVVPELVVLDARLAHVIVVGPLLYLQVIPHCLGVAALLFPVSRVILSLIQYAPTRLILRRRLKIVRVCGTCSGWLSSHVRPWSDEARIVSTLLAAAGWGFRRVLSRQDRDVLAACRSRRILERLLI